MALSERLAWILSLDADAAIRGFERVGDTAEKNLKKADAGLDKTAGKMTKVGAGMMAAAGVAGVGLWKLGGAAADLGETVSKTNVVFGEAAGKVEDWATKADKAAGLSKRAAMDAASTFGTLFTNIGKGADEAADMSLKMTQLAGDLASFSNASPEEAVMALGAALRGESEPIRRFGVMLDDATLKARAMALGIYEGTGSLTPAQRAQAAYAEILAQTTKQQGDFARTSDSAANQQRILAAQLDNTKTMIGQGVVPAMTSMLQGANAGLGALNALGPGALQAAGTFGTFTVAGIGAVGAISSISGQLIKMRTNLKNAEGGLTGMGKAAVGLGGAFAVAGIVLTLKQMNDESGKLHLNMQKLAKAADQDLVRAFDELGASGLGKTLKLQEQFADQISENVGLLSRFIDELERQGRVEEAAKYKERLEGRITEEKRLQETQKKGTELTQESSSATQKYAEDVEMSTKELDKLNKELDDYQGRIKAATDATFGARDADAAWNEALSNWRETIGKNGPTMDIWTEKGRENYRATKEVTGALDEVIARAAKDYPNSVAGFRGATDQYVAEWKKQLEKAGLTNKEIETFLGHIEGLRNQEEVVIRTRIQMTLPAGFDRFATADPEAAARVLEQSGLLGYDMGGVVPGPPGAPRLAVVHGGERYLGSPGSDQERAPGGSGAPSLVINMGFISGADVTPEVADTLAAAIYRKWQGLN